MKLQGTMSKLMEQVFKPIDTVVWDLSTNKTGIKAADGIYTLGEDGTIEMNPFDGFSMELPAFSQLVPIEQVKKGDVIVSGGKATGWVLESAMCQVDTGDDTEATKTTEVQGRKSITAISLQGHVTRFRPKNVSMLGIKNGITVVRSPLSFGGGEGGLASGTDGLSALLPLMLLGGSGTGGGQTDMKSIMMLSMLGNGSLLGGAQMNPLVMMALMGDGGPFTNR